MPRFSIRFPDGPVCVFGISAAQKRPENIFDEIAAREETQVFYESKHRIEKALAELAERLGDRPIIIARELTEQFETIYRGTAGECFAQLRKDKILGEFVIVARAKSK